jgi:putative Mg2+ transporter-C (MgtC) family protein
MLREFIYSEFAWVDGDYLVLIRIAFRLAAAMLLAGVVGWERGRRGHNAGLRTHILVGLGAAMFTIIPVLDTDGETDLAQVVKGVAAGIGFLGAGTILKDQQRQQIEGLTTAASIWLTAAIGMAAGAGYHFAALVCVILAWITLVPVQKLETHFGFGEASDQPTSP